MSPDRTVLGIDGCSVGWIWAAHRNGAWSFGVEETIRHALRAVPDVASAFVDVPIGLRDEGPDERACDLEARAVLGGRASSVFPAPSRPALGAPDYEAACDANERATGRRLSTQCWAIVPRIREVDALLRDEPDLRGVVREVHPELCFWALAGRRPMEHPKREAAGFRERLDVLRPRIPGLDALVDDALLQHAGDARRDDVLDALAAAVTARGGRGRYGTLPDEPERDPEGLPMEMVYWVPETAPSRHDPEREEEEDEHATSPTLTALYSHALGLSYLWHRTQARKGRDTPYLAHLMSVSALVLEAGGDEELGIAGLLHDALEDAASEADADARREVIRQEFGRRVLAAVEGCTDGTPAQRRRESWLERKRSFVAHVRDDAVPEAVAVSLCDKLHNARSVLRDLRDARDRGAEDEFWGLFSGGREGSLWYYGALEDAYRSRIPRLTADASGTGAALPRGFRVHLDELGAAVDELLELAGAEREGLAPPPG